MLTNRIKPSDIHRIGRIVVEKHPELVVAYSMPKDVFTDLSLIEDMHDYFFSKMVADKHDPFEKIVFVAVMMQLYAPGHLEYRGLNMRANLRSTISKAMKYINGTNINGFKDSAMAYYKGRGFKNVIKKHVDEMIRIYAHQN